MSKHLGDFDASTVVYGKFTTFRPSTGAAYTLAGSPALSVYKDNSTTQSTTGVTLTADFDSVTGLNHFAIDTSADGTFYSAGSFFDVVITTGTVDSVSVVGTVVASFTLKKAYAGSIVGSGTYGNAALKTLIDAVDDYVDTEVAAIKAKTDNLPSDPADASDIAAAFAALTTDVTDLETAVTDLANSAVQLDATGELAFQAFYAANTASTSIDDVIDAIDAIGGATGPGADTVTITIKVASVAVANAQVWISSDSGGSNVIAGTKLTNSQGEVVFLLDAGTTYYLWMQKDGVEPILGQSFVAVADT